MALINGANAETLRIATYNTDLQRKGPGLLLSDIEKAEDAQVLAVADVLVKISPDIVLLTSFDYDHDLVALSAFAVLLQEKGADYPHAFALRPNKGWATGLDMDGDGQLGRAGDAQGFGYFAGQGGMAILSRFPILTDEVQDYSDLLWQDFPNAMLPETQGQPFPSNEALAIQRLSTTGHWSVPVALNGQKRLTLLAWHATPPVFDGPEDRNGKRNHDETAFWTSLLDGQLEMSPPSQPFVILGDANLDPHDGDGLGAAMMALLAHSAVQDPEPESARGLSATDEQAGVNTQQKGRAELDTVDWPDDGPGNLRVDYVLPSADLVVTGAGVYWPMPDDPMSETVEAASPHRLVWVDVELP